MYEFGLGVSQDYAEAAKWYRKARGIVEARTRLGRLYKEGLGVPQNYAEAAELYRKAATFGEAEAEFDLGLMYEAGLGVPKDHSEALNWYHWAARHHHADALFYLASAHHNGRGVPRDLVKAYVFACAGINAVQRDAVSPRTRDLTTGIIVFSAVAQRGDISLSDLVAEKAKILDHIAADMAPAELEQAQRQTGDCGARFWKDLFEFRSTVRR